MTEVGQRNLHCGGGLRVHRSPETPSVHVLRSPLPLWHGAAEITFDGWEKHGFSFTGVTLDPGGNYQKRFQNDGPCVVFCDDDDDDRKASLLFLWQWFEK